MKFIPIEFDEKENSEFDNVLKSFIGINLSAVISFVLRFAFLLSSVHGFPLYYSMESLLPRLVVEVFISTSMG